MEFSILNLILVLLSAWLAGHLVSRLGYPSIFGELTAGILLGPPLLGILRGSEALSVLAEVGVLLMMLYIGMEIDPEELFEASWAGLLAAVGGFITPFVLAYFVVTWFGGSVAAGLFVGIAAGVTSLATKSRILVDLNLLDTRIAHVLMAGALIADTLSLIVFAAIIGVFEAGSLEMGELALVAGRAALFFAVTFVIGIKVFPLIWERLTHFKLTGRTFNATLILLVALFFAELAELAGLHAILGAFLAGLFLREGIVLERTLSQEMNALVHDISIGFLAPIFFVTAGFHVSLDVFQTNLPLLIGVVLVATFGKILGTALFYLPSRNGWREGLVVGAGMNGRGAVEIIIAEIGLRMGLISQEIFSILVFMAIFTTATVPLMLKWGTEWLERNDQLVRSKERNNTIIIGAGPVARALAKALSEKNPVWLIDSNRDHCETAMEEGLNVVYGNALEEKTLRDAKAEQARWFLALTPNSEVNTLSAQLARNVFKIPEVHVRLTHTQGRSIHDMLTNIQATPFYGEEDTFFDWDQWLSHNNVTPVTLTVSDTQEASDLMAEIDKRDGTFPLTVDKNGQRLPFFSARKLNPGDEVLAICRKPNGDPFDGSQRERNGSDSNMADSSTSDNGAVRTKKPAS